MRGNFHAKRVTRWKSASCSGGKLLEAVGQNKLAGGSMNYDEFFLLGFLVDHQQREDVSYLLDFVGICISWSFE